MEVIPPCAGFVGSDLLAGVLATRLTDQPGGLLIDFGTNSEMALWDGDTLWVTSAAGGPAFESSQVQCGMPAEPGAIYRVDRQPDSGELQFQVIGGGEAKGICGSGLVDLIACLRGSGDLTRTGRFAPQGLKDGFVVRQSSPTLRLSHVDVDMFQRAKAAIGVGIKTLLARARMDAAELSRVCVCGVFGQHMNAGNAQAIGLLPEVPLRAWNSVETRRWRDANGCSSVAGKSRRTWHGSDSGRRSLICRNRPSLRGCFWKAFTCNRSRQRQHERASESEPQLFEAFPKAAQYIVRLKSQQDVWDHLARLIVSYFPAEWVAFAHRDAVDGYFPSSRHAAGKGQCADRCSRRKCEPSSPKCWITASWPRGSSPRPPPR